MILKVPSEKFAGILKHHGISDDTVQAVVEEMHMLTHDEEGEKSPRVKKQYAIVVSDPNGSIPREEFVGWVLQIPEAETPLAVMEKVHQAAYDYNATRKGRLLPVNVVGEAFEAVPSKHFKEHECWVKTKEPVFVTFTNNVIPTLAE